MDDNAQIKAVLLVSAFTLSMVVVGAIAYKMETQAGYDDGYENGHADAGQYWADLINTNLSPLIEAVYLESFVDGFNDGYLWGRVDAWKVYGNGDDFRYPVGGVVT